MPDPRRPFLERRDVAWLTGLMAVGLGLRLRYWSGSGLLDDPVFFQFIEGIVSRGIVLPAGDSNFTYRVTWWIPTVLSCRILGINETALVLPILAASILGIGVVYALGKRLHGRSGGVIAAALLVVLPLDLAWSTMFTNDIVMSLAGAICMLCVLRAIDHPVARARSFLWAGAGLALVLAYHAKVSALALVPAIALILWSRRRSLDPEVRAFGLTAGVLFALSALVCYALAGDALSPLHSELLAQGLAGPAAASHRADADAFWTYPRLLFLRDDLGDRLFSLLPHMLVAGLLLSPLTGLRPALPIWWWLLAVFLAMEFNVQRVGGMWVAGFRNLRHAHPLVYPLVLLVAGYLTALRTRRPRVANTVVVVLLAVGAYESVAVASKTRIAFQDRRAAVQLLTSLPPRTIYADYQIGSTLLVLLPFGARTFYRVAAEPAARRAQFAALAPGYVVTGGAREPYYGCVGCIARADELDPAKWRIVKEFPSPIGPTPWRPEPLRVWEAIVP